MSFPRPCDLDFVARAIRAITCALLGTGAFVACATPGEGQPQPSVTQAPGIAKSQAVSVFGIFRNGHMSPDSWKEFGAALSAPFSQGTCEAVYTNDFVAANPELTSAVDDYTKEDGVSEELLAKFAPFAKGDTILVVAINGQSARPAADAGVEKAAKPPQDRASSGSGNYGGSRAEPGSGPGGGRGMGRGGGGFGRGGMGGRRPPPASSPRPKSEPGSWELTAFLYSVRLHRSTGQVDLTQPGQDVDRALKTFVAKLASEIPGVPCRGWDGSVKVDSDSIRKLAEP